MIFIGVGALKVMATIHPDRPEAPPADTPRGFRDLSNILSACYIFQFLQTTFVINHKASLKLFISLFLWK